MKKVFLLFLLYLFTSTLSSFAQNQKLDSLRLLLKSIQTDTQRVKTLNKIARMEVRKDKSTAEKALRLARQVGYKKGESVALYIIGLYLHFQRDYVQALEYFQQVVDVSNNIGDKKRVGTGYLLMAMTYEKQIRYEKTSETYEKALKAYKAANHLVGVGDVYSRIAVMYARQANYVKALDYSFKALKISEQTGDKLALGIIYNNISNRLTSLKKYKEAIKYRLKSLETFQEIKQFRYELSVLGNLSELYNELKRYNKSLQYANKMLVLAKQHNMSVHTIRATAMMAVIQSKQRKYAQAIPLMEKSLDEFEKLSEWEHLQGFAIEYAKALIEKKDYVLAEKYLQRGLKVATKIKKKESLLEVKKSFYELYKAKGNFNTALTYYEQYIVAKDSVFNKEKAKAISTLESTYKLEKKEQENQLLQKDKELKDKELKASEATREKQLYFIISISGALISALVLAIILFIYYRSKKKANKLLTELNSTLSIQKTEISEQNTELKLQKEEIHTQNEELQQQSEEIIAQRDAIEEQNKTLATKNHHIKQSINSAQTIQAAILPFEERLQELLTEYFILFRPRDIVSGDFYFLETVDNYTIIAAIDCTGHGVPGAFTSLIGYALLNDIVKAKGTTNPGKILEALRKDLKHSLKQEQTGASNGMDVAMITIEQTNDEQVKVLFAGAKRPLWYMDTNKEIQRVKGSSVSIGINYTDNRQITAEELILPKGTTLYLSSDGFADQNNVKRKKFGNTRIQNILIENSHLPLLEQQQLLETALDQFMEGTEQRDDILLMGVRI